MHPDAVVAHMKKKKHQEKEKQEENKVLLHNIQQKNVKYSHHGSQ